MKSESELLQRDEKLANSKGAGMWMRRQEPEWGA